MLLQSREREMRMDTPNRFHVASAPLMSYWHQKSANWLFRKHPQLSGYVASMDLNRS